MKALYRIHLVLGLIVSLPLLGWTTSGLWSALPTTAGGGTVYAAISTDRILISPAAAIERARAFAGKPLPITALTLEQKDGRVESADEAELRTATHVSAVLGGTSISTGWYSAGPKRARSLTAQPAGTTNGPRHARCFANASCSQSPFAPSP